MIHDIIFTDKDKILVIGNQKKAIQGMLDFDYASGRSQSVIGIIDSSGGFSKLFFGNKEVLIPIYKSFSEAPLADIIVNFSSQRSAYRTTKEILESDKLPKVIAVIAEGVPERDERELLHLARKKGVLLIGPATVGFVKAGALKVGNAGGDYENIKKSKLYKKGAIGIVSKSGGMLNELMRIASKYGGVNEGIAIGGDRFPGTTFVDHLLRFEKDPGIKFSIVLGEVGGSMEYEIIDAIERGLIKKPIIAYVAGHSAKMFKGSVQFGHAGARINNNYESAEEKTKALSKYCLVPTNFSELPLFVERLSKKFNIKEEQKEIREVPIDLNVALAKGLVRKPSTIITSISDERDILKYNGVPINEAVNLSLGKIIGLLWLKRSISDEFANFLELSLKITADHGPAVSGAMNTIITSRAGKDVIDSLVSGLLTIGPRFGGALNNAAKEFFENKDKDPFLYVEEMKKKGRYIPGIGHRVKSINNPDERVKILKEFANNYLKYNKHFSFALAVEQITTKKKQNLILNVDGAIASIILDFLVQEGFSDKEIRDLIDYGLFNGLFALGRSIGFVAHAIDQKRLKQKLYRTPYEDIYYLEDF